MIQKTSLILLLSIILANLSSAAPSQDTPTKASQDLAAAAQNPVADLISLPIQNNTNFNVGPDDDIQNIVNIQPVYPIQLNEDWNLVTRTIIPIVDQPDFGSSGSTFGLGDTSFTAFFSPTKPWNDVILGFGPNVILPTGTDERLGARQWGAGPSFVGVYTKESWVVGGLVSQVWGFGRGDDEDINNFLFQYFVNYNIDKGWYLLSAPVITADWNADSDERWVIPVGGGLGRVFKWGKQPVNINSQVFYNVETPDNGPEWQWRFQIQWLFPK